MQTFRLKTNSGLTLIEILLVVALIAMLSGGLLPQISGLSRAGTKSSVRRFSSVVRHAYDQAILTGLVHRIVINFETNSWELQNATPGVLPFEEIKKKYAYEEDEKTLLAQRKKVEGAFKQVDLDKSGRIPKGVKIVEFISWRTGATKVINQGQASIFAFPNGFIDEATLVVAEIGQENVQRFRLTIKSLTGKVALEVENIAKQ